MQPKVSLVLVTIPEIPRHAEEVVKKDVSYFMVCLKPVSKTSYEVWLKCLAIQVDATCQNYFALLDIYLQTIKKKLQFTISNLGKVK